MKSVNDANIMQTCTTKTKFAIYFSVCFSVWSIRTIMTKTNTQARRSRDKHLVQCPSTMFSRLATNYNMSEHLGVDRYETKRDHRFVYSTRHCSLLVPRKFVCVVPRRAVSLLLTGAWIDASVGRSGGCSGGSSEQTTALSVSLSCLSLSFKIWCVCVCVFMAMRD